MLELHVHVYFQWISPDKQYTAIILSVKIDRLGRTV